MDLLSLIFGLSFTVVTPSCVAQDSPEDFVNAHNTARAKVGVGPVEWDESVASYARQYAKERINDCELIHSTGGPYGENLAWGMPDLSGTSAVEMWFNEKEFYDYDTDTCAAGKMCGHYTQVVWKNSTRIGCAKVKCMSANAGSFITCNYDPVGNIIGQKPF